jgi:hypothetical protein
VIPAAAAASRWWRIGVVEVFVFAVGGVAAAAAIAATFEAGETGTAAGEAAAGAADDAGDYGEEDEAGYDDCDDNGPSGQVSCVAGNGIWGRLTCNMARSCNYPSLRKSGRRCQRR